MKTFLISAAALMMACTLGSQTADIAGHWIGRLNANAFPVDIVLHLDRDDTGGYSSSIDIPGQFEDLDADTTWFSGDTLITKWLVSQTVFRGVLNNAGQLAGTWSTRGNATPITFNRSEDGVYRRPQEPTGDVPYEVREVSFPSRAGRDIRLAATLTLPVGAESYPAVVMITGSGAQDRDEAVYGHRPFLVLADRLTRAGIATLRFDDRGTAGSTGTFEGATTEDFARDALGAVDFLDGLNLPLSGIGLLGHTEGGSAGMIAAAEEDIAFLVLLATVGIPHEDLLIGQSVAALTNAGTPEPLIRIDTQYTRKLYRNMRKWPPAKPDTAAVREILDEFYARSDLIRTRFRNANSFYSGQMQIMTSPWFHYYATFIPEHFLSRVDCPVLAINGSEDIQVEADTNLDAINRILKESPGNHDHVIMKLDGLNHFFQPAEGDIAHEYGLIMTTFDEGAMDAIADWILAAGK